MQPTTNTLRPCTRLHEGTGDPSTRKILEGGTTFRLVYLQEFRSGWLLSGEGKEGGGILKIVTQSKFHRKQTLNI